MLTSRIIPCLDLKDGRVVKGVRFAGLRDAGDPVELADRYEAEGADELVLLDVSATPEGRGHAVATVRAVRRSVSIPLCVGGGIRCTTDAAALLDAGADKIAVNSAAVREPGLLTSLADQFGRQCVVIAIDSARRIEAPDDAWEVVVLSGRERTGLCAIDWAEEAAIRGAGEVLLTSWDRDGTQSGYDLPLVRAVSERVRVPVIASGGAQTAIHMKAALDAGASAVLAASIFHDEQFTVREVKRALAAQGIEIRP